MQANLLPLQIVDVDECAPDGADGADIRRYGTGQDGHEYAIKDAVAHPLQPASEYFCYCLASRCQVPVPRFEIVRLPDQTYAFGSRWDGAALKRNKADPLHCPATAFWSELGKQTHLAGAFSSIHALDLFVMNEDRHLWNFLPAMARTKYTVSAFDFGRAWWSYWPIGTRLPDRYSNTAQIFRYIAKTLPIDVTLACRVLDAISSIQTADVKQWVAPMTAFILPQSDADALYDWWASPERAVRLRHIRKHLTDGNYAR